MTSITNHTHIFIEGLELQASIGVYEHERVKKQRVLLSIDLWVEPSAHDLADSIENTVSYETMITRAEAILSSSHINLVETLAERLATACLEDGRVKSVRVRVEKPDVFPHVKGVGVAIQRHQP